METDESKVVLLISEWREILRNQRQIRELRKSEMGILVSDDDLAQRFQALQKRIYEIKWQLFGKYYLDVGV